MTGVNRASRDLLEAKEALRRRMLAARNTIPPAERMRHSEEIARRVVTLPEAERAGRVFTFLSFGSEVSTEPLIDFLERRRMDSRREIAVLVEIGDHTRHLITASALLAFPPARRPVSEQVGEVGAGAEGGEFGFGSVAGHHKRFRS